MRVLVTGASGRIGTSFVAGCEGGRLQVVRADLRDGASSPFPFEPLDITDPDACRRACDGADGIVHLAADPSPTADFDRSVLPVNIVGTYNVLAAAVAAGVSRVVYASSAQAVEGYPVDYQVRESDPPRPSNDYGVGKAFGEALCASLAVRSATSFVAVRIGYYAAEPPDPAGRRRDRMAWISPRDANQLLTLALTADVTGGHVAHGSSDNAMKRLSLQATRALLGYEPRDDAFAT